MADRGVGRRVPLTLKLIYSGFVAVWIPVYWVHYGPTNFLYFCDVALLFTLFGLWLEHPLLVSIPAVGILLPQIFWCVDFGVQLCGGHLSGMTGYMFDAHRPLFLRGLSLFHGWLPFLLLYLLVKLGYDRRAAAGWSVLCVTLCLVAYFWLPPADPVLAQAPQPCNVNYVYGFDDARPQTWLPPLAYLGVWMVALLACICLPTHLLLKKFCRAA